MKIPKFNLAVPVLFLVLLSLLVTQNVLGFGSIQNPSFEDDTGWTYYESDSYWTGEYTNSWATQGSRSFLIQIPINGCTYYPPAHSYGEVYQDVDLTGISAILFDLRVRGWFYAPGLGAEYYYSTEVWIGDTMLYSVEKQANGPIDLTYIDQTISTAGYNGVYRLTFRMQSHASSCTDSPRQMYFDNVSLVPISFSYNYLPIITK
jgi:hypothetical protein